jgi:hypothetical protein
MDTTIAVAYAGGGDLPDPFDQMSLSGQPLNPISNVPNAAQGGQHGGSQDGQRLPSYFNIHRGD